MGNTFSKISTSTTGAAAEPIHPHTVLVMPNCDDPDKPYVIKTDKSAVSNINTILTGLRDAKRTNSKPSFLLIRVRLNSPRHTEAFMSMLDEGVKTIHAHTCIIQLQYRDHIPGDLNIALLACDSQRELYDMYQTLIANFTEKE